jgi:hypothetical protein
VKNVTKKLCVGLLSLVFLFVLVSATPVEAKVPLRWEHSVSYMGGIYWEGDIWTEDGSHGDFSWQLTDYVILSNLQKLSVIWRIEWDGGGYIEGTLDGIFVFETHEYGLDGGYCVGNGKVTDTSADWSHVYGRIAHLDSYICPWPWVAEGIFQIN